MSLTIFVLFPASCWCLQIGRQSHFVGNNLLGKGSAVNCTPFRSAVSGYTVNSSLLWRFDCLVVKIEKPSEITGRCWY